ncbi:toxin YdaT family protein [Lelliottia sp. V89_10]|uniref:toxin YdaT family protein n=1 Tax=Lelliottia wanjuensis TaxID=3050585 RepID=UPI00249E90AE|nr:MULTISPECIES: toxin YdaT family protein [unclassified Lelliottia]MDI3359742.1 toxin YdaT family protein [Lelliottia sp. V89_13]MDK9548700.1 toxin YdaT family protein [Lelliottia sp. V89_5]MDK9597332.1 toxin YdaT family protein [Lelliottia sp. V89_10]
MDIKTLAIETEAWAKGRWKTAAELITKYHAGDLLQPLAGITDAAEFSRRLHNNTQTIQRALRIDTANYRRRAAELAPAIRAAMDSELAQQHNQHAQVAIANKECIEATSAVLTGKPQAVIRQEAFEAIDALAQLAGVTVHIAHERRAA